MSGKSKMNIILPFLHMQVPLTKAYSATYNPNPNKIQISENRKEKRREESIVSREGASNKRG